MSESGLYTIQWGKVKVWCSLYNPPLDTEWKYFIKILRLYQTKQTLKPDFVDVDGSCSEFDPQ